MQIPIFAVNSLDFLRVGCSERSAQCKAVETAFTPALVEGNRTSSAAPAIPTVRYLPRMAKAGTTHRAASGPGSNIEAFTLAQRFASCPQPLYEETLPA